MSASEELNEVLFRKYRENKDIKLRNELVANNIHIAQLLARKFLGRGTDYDDLLQIASLALINAVERYDLKYDTKFITFATPTIIGELKKYFRDKVPMVRLPRRVHEIRTKIGQVKSELQSKLGRVPTAADLAEHLGIPLETILESMEANYNYTSGSIDASLPTDEDTDLHDMLGAEDSNYAAFENKELLEKVFDALDAYEKELIKLRFYKELTQAEIAARMNVSQMYISRLEKKTLEKIRKLVQS